MTDRKVDGKICDQSEASFQTLQAQDEMMNHSFNLNYTTMLVERNGEMVEIEIPIEDIDLLDDFEDEDLTAEGQRSLGMVSEDFDSTSEEPLNVKSRNKLPVVTIEIEDETICDIEIVCPYTGSNEVYQVDSETWASYETDQPFIVVFKSLVD